SRPSEQKEIIRSLLGMQQATTRNSGATEKQTRELLARSLSKLVALLRALSFPAQYRLCVWKGDHAELWTGLNRLRIADCGLRNVGDAGPPSALLLDADNRPVLSLWPLMQVAEPAPGVREELFMLEGRGRNGAKLT